MRIIFAVFAFLLLLPISVAAQDGMPDRRFSISRDLDFYGADLQSIFDTTFEVCQRTCLADTQCKAFTFNKRSNACFTKKSVEDTVAYEGALSGRVWDNDPRLVASAAQRLTEIPFVGQPLRDGAYTLAANLGQYHYSGEWGVEDLLNSASDREANGDLMNALHFVGGALSLTDSSDLWVEYARLALAVKFENSATQNTYRQRAMWAAINGYIRAVNNPQKSNALFQLALAFEANNLGRQMIPALNKVAEIAPRADADALLESAIAKYGFRITGNEIESDLAAPRICATFSENLVAAGVDYTSYMQFPSASLAVEVENDRLCISGLSHGERAKFTFRQGLPAASGETLAKDVEITGYVRDRTPSVSFPSRAYVLPKTPNAALPIESVNASEIDLTLRRVSDRNLLRAIQDNYFGRPMSTWTEQTFASEIAEDIWTGTATLTQDLNQDVTTRLPLDEALTGQPAGIYALKASIPGTDPYDNPPATQWFVLSDLGVATASGIDGLHVFVRSLASADVKSGVTVTLLSEANSVLAEGLTDAKGYVHFDAGLTLGTAGRAPALVTVTDGETDIAFLSLKDAEFDLSDRGVEGRPPAPPIDVFMTTDRGAYRAGETVNVTALLRDQASQALQNVPVTAILRRPDGVEYTRQVSTSSEMGGHVLSLPIAATAPRGKWTLALYADPEVAALATQTFLVEDFLPERIDFTWDFADTPLRPGQDMSVAFDVKYLFGAPAEGMGVSGSVSLRASEGLSAYPGYQFGRYDESFYAERTYFDGGDTDAQGMANAVLTLPESDGANRPLSADFTFSVTEGSGRPVERRETRDLDLAGSVIGIKPQFDDVVAEGTAAEFLILPLDKTQTPVAMDLVYAVNRVETTYQWYQQYGNWDYEPITRRTRVDSGKVTFTGDPITVSTPVEWGHYELVVERAGGEALSSSLDFYAGWYVAADVTTTPDVLDVSLDKASYVPGETATLRFVPRYAGKALITVMSNHLIDMKMIDVVEGENTISLPVTEAWGGGAYVTATVIRPMDTATKHNPARALGLSYAPVDPGARVLTVTFLTPEEVAPRGPLDVSLKVDGIEPHEDTYVTIAAVDVGILNLTGFEAPDVSGHYFGQRRLGVGLRDIYGRLLDGMNGAMGEVRSGGDAAQSGSFDAPPPTEELVAYFSGPLKVAADGTVQTTFDLPSFNGTVRLMAVVWSDTAVGEAQADILVRDPVVVTASVPRFMAPNDTSRLLLEIVHAKGPAGHMDIAVSSAGLDLDITALATGFELAENGTARLTVPIRATHTGLQEIAITLITPDGKILEKTLTLPVQNNDPAVMRTSRFDLANDKSLLFNKDVFAGLLPGTGEATLAIGTLAQFDAPGLLSALDRYPYGCTEQVTSRAMPLLYLSSVAEAMDLDTPEGLNLRIDQAIIEVLANQSSSGAFGLWRPESGSLWLDAYVTDFLSRARVTGHDVPDLALRSALDNLRNQVNYNADFDSGGEGLAYALLVLAREGAAAMGDLRYYADVKGDAFATPLAQAQIGAALASYGDQTRADRMFKKAAVSLSRMESDRDRQYWRADFGTNLRDTAAVITLAVESGSTALDIDALTQLVTQNGEATRSTQENMWTLMAANALLEDPSVAGFTVDGVPATGPLVRVLDAQTNAGQSLDIRNQSGKTQQVTVTTYGVPEVPEPARGNGMSITRSYFTMDGEAVTLDSVSAGTRLVTVLEITPFRNLEARLMVADPLPAGFEIDNPSLLQAGDIKSLEWLDLDIYVENAEYRQDRFLAAVNHRSDKAFNLAYIVRAVSPGDYHHPAASVEDMYRPQFRAHTDSGRVSVVE
ncbi:alpha-2-macroglobulin family protein [Falsihalocynthiibacter arcticus]|uniref:PAN domain-containing protein n=1 Tax=Falsihalocynthiibacter arcticus TaxID=1579316 RepID=A0A126UY30_9RHOB|nr:alpha-2-macroglobulin family protein [Falsihalocynthiibacter arcticus]AML50982.1 PAN domain-containing protein [Falsihalocynthiibacter arcticus]